MNGDERHIMVLAMLEHMTFHYALDLEIEHSPQSSWNVRAECSTVNLLQTELLESML